MFVFFHSLFFSISFFQRDNIFCENIYFFLICKSSLSTGSMWVGINYGKMDIFMGHSLKYQSVLGVLCTLGGMSHKGRAVY